MAQRFTLSVRINDALRVRLERAKTLRASTTGERVSTSQIAKELLENGTGEPPGDRHAARESDRDA
jgi:hypothetical protein